MLALPAPRLRGVEVSTEDGPAERGIHTFKRYLGFRHDEDTSTNATRSLGETNEAGEAAR